MKNDIIEKRREIEWSEESLENKDGAEQDKVIGIIQITDLELQELNNLINYLSEKYEVSDNEEFIYKASFYSSKLPIRLVQCLHEFKYKEDHYGAIIIRGFVVNNEKIGTTPSNSLEKNNPRVLEEEILLVLLNSILGDLFGWSSQREGALINDIVPIKGHEYEQLSTASQTPLEWHVEEAFHPFRPDYLCLMCLRNNDEVATTFCSVSNVTIPDHFKDILFEPHFIIGTDNNFQSEKLETLRPVPVLFGAYDSPYICIDPAFMGTLPGNEEASEALSYIINTINDNLDEVVLHPGDFCFIDNYRAVHGRKMFIPKYDGNDRWLKRVLTTRDLRKSRAIRKSFNSRVLITG